MDDDDEFPHRRDNLFWGLISAALLSGVGSGVLTVTQTEDRYYSTDAVRDFRLVDQKISSLQQRVTRIESDVDRIDLSGPAIGNAYLRKTLEDVESRVDDLEKSK